MKLTAFEKKRLSDEQLDIMSKRAARETPTHLFVLVSTHCAHFRASTEANVGTCAAGVIPGPLHVSACHACPSKAPVLAPVDSRPVSIVEAAKNGLHAAASVVRTSCGIDRATPDEQAARLAVCAACPGDHAMKDKDGKVTTCGPMLSAAKAKGEGTCGCVLTRKAADRRETCPFTYWPTITVSKC